MFLLKHGLFYCVLIFLDLKILQAALGHTLLQQTDLNQKKPMA